MRNNSLVFLLLICCLKCLAQDLDREEKNNIYLADPTIFLYNDTYYLYGTTAGSKESTGDGFLVYTSRDLENWDGPKGAREGFALRKEDAFGTTGFWAPQVFRYKEKFYMAYTANENIAIATSDNPLGPFTNTGESLKASVRQIDPFVFFDDDGKKYLFHVRLENGNRIFVAELNDDLMGIKPETLKECISSEQQWENTSKAKWPVAEGPTVIKRRNIYYLIYSANDFRNPDYAVGYAISKNPLGPWKKVDKNPIISRNKIDAIGPGHGDTFFSKSGKMYYVFHTHFSAEKVRPRKTAIVEMEFAKEVTENPKLQINKKTVSFLEKDSER